jgi:putative radical SAM enzyme (TIGR03279 family)
LKLIRNGEEFEVNIRKSDEFADIGLEFETYLMDKQHSCKNKCIFCFVDQMPKGMRDTLYFKDDDSRLSFLFGNYITLTGLCERETQRIIDMHISPVNISVHTMNPSLRVEMMKNRFAGDVLKNLNRFAENNIEMNTQLVLCPGINDGDELRFSLSELAKLYPAVKSIAAVPVGLTKYRYGLYPLRTYTKEEASQVIDIIDEFNAHFSFFNNGEILAYASDEFYLLAERDLPSADYYGEFAQLDNGVVIRRTGINHDLGWSRVDYNGQPLYCITSYLKVVG